MHGATLSAFSPVVYRVPPPVSPVTSVQHRLGKRLRALRRERAWTQTHMADYFGVSRPFISDVERGRKTVSLRTLEIFAMGLKMSISDLLDGI